MFSPLIHSTTNYAKRKPIARLFEPIRLESNDYWAVAISYSGEPDESVTAAYDNLGTFAERNAKSSAMKTYQCLKCGNPYVGLFCERCLRHAETEPQAKDGWHLIHGCQVYGCYKHALPDYCT